MVVSNEYSNNQPIRFLCVSTVLACLVLVSNRLTAGPVYDLYVCEFQNRTTQNSGAQAGASPGGRAYMTTGKRPASGAPLRR